MHVERRTKVLLVDDSSFIRWGLSEDLKGYGYQPIEADCGQQALDVLKSEPDIGLILLDVQMKGWTGFDTLQAIRSRENREALKQANNEWVPVVFVTAQDTAQDRIKGFELGAAEFILKADVRHTLREITGRFLNPSGEFKELGVLLVDDSSIIRHMVKACIQPYGVKIYEASDGRQALDVLRKEGDAVNVVVTDLQMPEMNGDLLCIKIRKELNRKDLPVIFLSSTDNAESVLTMFRAGGSDYIHKPFVREEMAARMEVHMRRQLLDRQLRNNIEELHQLNSLKDRFLAICSHDLRSPLSGMIGLTELLIEDEATSEEHREMLRHIVNSGDYLLDLINDILDLGRVQATAEKMVKEPVDLVEVLESCLVTMKHNSEAKSIELCSVLQKGVMIEGDTNALRRVFSNLLSNAVKFTRMDGVINLKMQVYEEKKQVEVWLQDNGIGIPEDMLEHLFDEYSKVSRPGTAGEKGTGLGMAITRKLVEAHGGSIQVKSREGKGTEFTLRFPLLEMREDHEAGDDAQSELQEEMVKEENPCRGLRVLAAEDNRVNQEYLRRMLEEWGCSSDLVENGRLAVNLFEEELDRSPYDLVLLDIEMPEMDGYEAVRLIRVIEEEMMTDTGREVDTRVYALSAHTDDESVEKIRNTGMDGLVAKPIKKEALYKVLCACRKT